MGKERKEEEKEEEEEAAAVKGCILPYDLVISPHQCKHLLLSCHADMVAWSCEVDMRVQCQNDIIESRIPQRY